MNTKSNPSPQDCYAKALPDEPMFTLLARDATAPYLVGLWLAVRAGRADKASEIFMNCFPMLCAKFTIQPDKDLEAKSEEAARIAEEMLQWYEKHVLYREPKP